MICINIQPLEGNMIAPPLVLNKDYGKPQVIHTCDCGQDHYDVGLKSTVTFVRCYKCKKELPLGHIVWWTHPSRFEHKAQ